MLGVDHAGAFADAADPAFLPAGGEADGDLFAFCIGGHDALGSLIGVRAEAFDQLRDPGCDGRNVERLADHAGRRDHNVGRANMQRLPQKFAHLLGDCNAVGVAGVGVAAVADDGLRLAIGKMLLRHDERRALDQIGRIDGGCAGRDAGIDQREIALRFILPDAAVDAGGRKACRGAHAACDLFHLWFLPVTVPDPAFFPRRSPNSYTRLPRRTHPCRDCHRRPAEACAARCPRP